MRSLFKLTCFILITILVLTCVSCTATYKREDELDGSPMKIIAPDGTKYMNISAYGYQYIKLGQRIGSIGWSLNIFGAGVYAIKGNDDNSAIVIKEPLSEFDMIFCRSDIQPDYTYSAIQWVEDTTDLDKYPVITEQWVIDDFLENEAMQGVELEYDVLLGTAYLYCYSKNIPGLICSVIVFEYQGSLWCESSSGMGYVKLSGEYLLKLTATS